MTLWVLDLFCGAGGCTRGYQQAGFSVVGVDIARQPRYVGEEFIQADVMTWLPVAIKYGYTDRFAFIHASPPCQFASEATPVQHRENHQNLIPAVRELLIRSGRPYVIENVEGARGHLVNPVMLCGSMFGLPLWRHRYFECRDTWFMSPAMCDHARRPVTFTSGSHSRALNRKMSPVLISGTTPRSAANGGRFEYTVQDCRDAAEIQWMTRTEIDQAIPPAYTRYIGEQMRRLLP